MNDDTPPRRRGRPGRLVSHGAHDGASPQIQSQCAAPLSEWLITGAFDTGAECNAAQLQSKAGAWGEFADEPFFAIANPEQRKMLMQAFKSRYLFCEPADWVRKV